MNIRAHSPAHAGSVWSQRLQSLWGAAFVVAGLTASAKVAALLKDSLVASQFGNGAELDAFLLALVVPGFLISVAAGTLPAALTPTYIAIREQNGVDAARELARAALAPMTRWLTLLAVVASIASLGYAYMPSENLATTTRESLPWLAVWMAPYTLLQGVCASWSGLLAAERRYAVSALAPIAQPLAMALAILIGGSSLGVGILVVGLLAGTAVQGAILVYAMRRVQLPTFVWRATRDVSSTTRLALSRVRTQYVPAVAGTVLMSATTVVDHTMATWLPAGSISALGFGTKLSSVMMSVGAIALSTTLLPHFSEMVAREEWAGIRRVVRRVALVILATTIPVTIIGVFAGESIVRLLFQRGAFTAAETVIVAKVQSAYLLQLPVHLLGILYVRLISSLQANRLLTIGSAVNLTVNIGLNVVFMRWFGVAGIALSTAGVYAVSCAYLAVAAHRRLHAAEQAANARRTTMSASVTTEVPCASAA